MEAQIGKEHDHARATPERRELALDLTPDEVVLHEGGASGWRKFAGVALDDPEFLEVIGLLRAEAESALGGGPVRLWLPGEQVLKLSLRLEGEDPRARLAAAVRQASRETGHAAGDLAVAVAPDGPSGAATVLVTYAATWREARDYAARWGFEPGAVSTRHHAEDFGPGGPVFVLAAEAGDKGPESPGETDARARAWVAVAVAAVIWSALPATIVAGEAPAAAPLPEPRAAWTAAEAAESGGEAGSRLAMVLPPTRPGTPPSGPEATDAPAKSAARPAAVSGTAAGAGVLPPVRPAFGMRADRAALVGVLNLESGRAALLRLPGGVFRKARVGDVLDGWEVTAIGADAMQIRRGAESRTLLLVTR